MQVLCLRCSVESEISDDHKGGCPNCGDSQGVPADVATRRPYLITPHELSCLIIWSERWAAQSKDGDSEIEQGFRRRQFLNVVHGIGKRLEDQYPDDSRASPLSMAGQIQQLRDEFGHVEQNIIPEDEPEPPSTALKAGS